MPTRGRPLTLSIHHYGVRRVAQNQGSGHRIAIAWGIARRSVGSVLAGETRVDEGWVRKGVRVVFILRLLRYGVTGNWIAILGNVIMLVVLLLIVITIVFLIHPNSNPIMLLRFEFRRNPTSQLSRMCSRKTCWGQGQEQVELE